MANLKLLTEQCESFTAEFEMLKKKELDLQTLHEKLLKDCERSEALVDTCSATLEEQYKQHQQELEISISTLQEQTRKVKEEMEEHRRLSSSTSLKFLLDRRCP